MDSIAEGSLSPVGSERKLGFIEIKKHENKKSKNANHNKRNVHLAQTPSPSCASAVPLLPWNEPPLMDLDAFATLNSLYPHCVVTMYQIVRDLYIKQEVIDIQLVDGKSWQRDEYFILGTSRASGTKRLMIPFYLDADIDLPWLLRVASSCKNMKTELYICVHTPETIM